MDILRIVYDELIENDRLKDVKRNIKFFEFPETREGDDPVIIIDPLDPSDPSDYADNVWMTYDFQIQIDVFSRDRKECREIANEIRDVMWDKLGFYQKSGPQEYDDGDFRDARRYRGKLYRDDLESLN